ncbi:YihY/virulence factor BrkB family protein [Caulobacter sp. 17J65-9]|uniref:YihY/virulence factor BrkB family protein n=1 Tax=Caulobacter sp. 17J65-9 TaxID=2709382 RepID=UPI003204D41C
MAIVSRERAQAGRRWLGVVGRALGRLWGRDVMLYVGGVSFFALLAVFPAMVLLIGLYSQIFTPAQAADQAAALSHIVPAGARAIFESELTRLTQTSVRTASAQSAFAAIIGVYAAHRGVKALLAGLTFIHDEEEPLGFVRFNVLVFVVAMAAFALFTVVTGAIVTARVVKKMTETAPLQHVLPFDSEWLWAGAGLAFGLTALYRYAMSHSGKVVWPAAITGGVAATLLSTGASVASAFYVDKVVVLGATYGSVGAVVVFLIWLSWNVNAIFLGGALATEVEIALDAYQAEARGVSLQPAEQVVSP